jgi:hypothetical protein
MRAISWSMSCMIAVLIVAALAPADNSQAYGYGVRGNKNSASGAIFLDVNGNLSLDVTHDGFSAGWEATGAYGGLSWHKLVYGHSYGGSDRIQLDDQPSGWYQIEMKMDLPPANATGWYKLELWLTENKGTWSNAHKMYLSVILNNGFTSAFPYYDGSTDYAIPQEHIHPNGQTWFGCLNTSPLTGLPWRISDFGSVWGIGLDYDYQNSAQTTTVIYLWAVLVPTSAPPAAPFANQILRPDGDIENQGAIWDGNPSPDLWANVDESTFMSDNLTSAIASSSIGGSCSMTFTDPNESLVDKYFNVTLWVICKSTTDYSWQRTLGVGLTSGPYAMVEQTTTVTSGFGNYSFSFPVNPGTGQAWTWSDLVDLKVFVRSANNMTISQIAVLVRDVDYVPPEEQGDSWSVISWVSGGGIFVLLALLGFFGMIATPTICYLQYRAGDDAIIAGSNGIWLMMLFFGFFVSGLWALS